MKLKNEELKQFLEDKYLQYNTKDFIPPDPVSIPHRFTRKEDIEIAGFLTSAISWGQRTTILRNANSLMERMEEQPYEFIISASETDINSFQNFVHRTFNGEDCIYFLKSLRNIYVFHGGLEKVISQGMLKSGNMMDALAYFRSVFFDLPFEQHVLKHIPNTFRNASAKRLNMFLRWMVRKDSVGVDFGIWKSLNTDCLMCPLDVHTGNVARKIGLLERKQDDRKAVEELTNNLRKFDPADPVKYDFALFGLGIYEGFA